MLGTCLSRLNGITILNFVHFVQYIVHFYGTVLKPLYNKVLGEVENGVVHFVQYIIINPKRCYINVYSTFILFLYKCTPYYKTL